MRERWVTSPTTLTVIDVLAATVAISIVAVCLPALLAMRLRDDWKAWRGYRHVGLGCGHGYWLKPGQPMRCPRCGA